MIVNKIFMFVLLVVRTGFEPVIFSYAVEHFTI